MEQETMERTESLGERVLDSLREAYCAMHGHDSLMQFEPGRLCLKCVSCGHETPGWQLDETPPARQLRGKPAHHVLTHLVGVRRVA
jgi:hypothetical protein